MTMRTLTSEEVAEYVYEPAPWAKPRSSVTPPPWNQPARLEPEILFPDMPDEDHDSLRTPEFRCIECDQTFLEEDSLKWHMELHKPIGLEKAHACELCPKAFTLKKDLIRHRSTVHSDELAGSETVVKYFCPVEGCRRSALGLGFSREDNMRQHCANVHGEHLPSRTAMQKLKLSLGPIFLGFHGGISKNSDLDSVTTEISTPPTEVEEIARILPPENPTDTGKPPDKMSRSAFQQQPQPSKQHGPPAEQIYNAGRPEYTSNACTECAKIFPPGYDVYDLARHMDFHNLGPESASIKCDDCEMAFIGSRGVEKLEMHRRTWHFMKEPTQSAPSDSYGDRTYESNFEPRIPLAGYSPEYSHKLSTPVGDSNTYLYYRTPLDIGPSDLELPDDSQEYISSANADPEPLFSNQAAARGLQALAQLYQGLDSSLSSHVRVPAEYLRAREERRMKKSNSQGENGNGDQKSRILFAKIDKQLRKDKGSDNYREPETKELHSKYLRFKENASEAFAKLTSATKDPKRTDMFRAFVSSLGSVEDVIDNGCTVFYEFLEKRIPTHLKDLYCMHHVSYAMSKSLAESKDIAPMTDAQFAQSAAEWKSCLPQVSEEGVFEQDLYEEIISVMWAEIKQGMEFASELLELFDASIFDAPMPDLDSWLDPPVQILESFDTNDPSMAEIGAWSRYGSDLESPRVEPCLLRSIDGNNDLALGQIASPPNNCRHIDKPSGTIDPRTLCCNSRGYANLTSLPPSSYSCQEMSLFSGNTQYKNCKDPPPNPLPTPTWETLAKNPIVTAALNFLQDLRETGAIFLYICGSLGISLLSAFCKDTKDTPPPPRPVLSIHERGNILISLTKALSFDAYPHARGIISAVSKPFLDGSLNDVHDLEYCMISFLKIQTTVLYTMENTLTAIISNLRSIYQTLPGCCKCPSDEYNSPVYVPRRIYEEIECISPSPSVSSPASIDIKRSSSVGSSSFSSGEFTVVSEPKQPASIAKRDAERAAPAGAAVAKKAANAEFQIKHYEHGQKRKYTKKSNNPRKRVVC
ncbi:hypothetical protein ABW19_dt0210044 [Dactylella cylindrospora]|nr:hypothetical protein ABW19_dt0210044 [Dactylella cylindrospora]